MYNYNKYSVTLPHGGVGWYAVCDRGISMLILTFFLKSINSFNVFNFAVAL